MSLLLLVHKELEQQLPNILLITVLMLLSIIFLVLTTANELVEYAVSKGQKAIAISGDLTKEADANALVEKTVEALGGLDILINNAGSLVARNLLSDIKTDFWHKVMDINLTSMMFVTRAAGAYLAKNENSSIVNLASLAGRKGGHPGSLAYATSKGAILTFTRALATEYGASRYSC